MCRMFLIKGEFCKNFEKIFSLSKNISEADPLHLKYNGVPANHQDGWGYFNISEHNSSYFRSDLPLSAAEKPEVEDGYLLLHMRNAAPNEPKGIHNSHPFHLSTLSGDIYLAHNGWFDKKKIAEFLGLSNYENENDSLVFLRLISFQNGDIKDKINKAMELAVERDFIKSLANLLIIYVDKSGNNFGFAISEASPNYNYGRYHELFLIENEKWKGIFSSSFLEYEFFKNIKRINKLKRGELYEL